MSESRSSNYVHHRAKGRGFGTLIPGSYLFLVLITFHFINIRNMGKLFLFFLPKDTNLVLFYDF